MKTENEEKDTEEKKDPDLVEFTNQMFLNFRNNPGIGAITQAKGWNSDIKFKLVDFMLGLTECKEIKAFDETIKYIKEAHDEEQKIAKERGETPIAFTGDEPGVLEFLEQTSGFSVKKLKLKIKAIPEGVAPSDIMMARWLIEIRKSEKG